jgi:hypothetical protein
MLDLNRVKMHARKCGCRVRELRAWVEHYKDDPYAQFGGSLERWVSNVTPEQTARLFRKRNPQLTQIPASSISYASS